MIQPFEESDIDYQAAVGCHTLLTSAATPFIFMISAPKGHAE